MVEELEGIQTKLDWIFCQFIFSANIYNPNVSVQVLDHLQWEMGYKGFKIIHKLYINYTQIIHGI